MLPYQPARNKVQHHGPPACMQPVTTFNARPTYKPVITGPSSNARPRKPKGGKGGRPKYQQGAAFPSTTPVVPFMTPQGQQGAATAFASMPTLLAGHGQMVLMQNQPQPPI